jgi:hydroxypyruvate isomerase
MLFPEVPFLERIRKAKANGFTHVEFWLWQDKNLEEIGETLQREGMKLGVFQGNTRGTMVDPADHAAYCEGVLESMEIAKKLGAENLFCMTDILRASDRTVEPAKRPIPFEEKEAAVVSVLKELAPAAAAAGITLLAEPLNTLVDHAGYFIERSSIAWEIHRKVGSPAAKILYDVYHMQVMEGNLISTIRANAKAIGYIHVADVPGRHEPGTGEINYRNVAAALRDSGYDGAVGFEFIPSRKTEEALAEARAAFRF